MAVSLKPKWTKRVVSQQMAQERQRLVKAVILLLTRIGEQFVVNARTKTADQGGFRDRTGNLRNSIGYIVLDNGNQVASNFRQVISGGGEGTAKGQRLAESVARSYPQGFVLIVVAGMEYAASVEARGRDVITGSSLVAKNALKDAIRELKQKMNNRAL